MSDRGSPVVAPHFPTGREHAFTLIELLVVIGIIALTASVLGVAFRGGNSSAALQSAQGIVGSMLSAVRSHAGLQGKEAALMINNDSSDADRYLRTMAIAVSDGGTGWIQIGDFTNLPSGCAFLPDASPTGALVETGVDFGGLKSSALTTATLSIPTTTTAISYLAVRFTPLGAPAAGSAGVLALATFSAQPPGASPAMKFNNAKNVRGVMLSAYGSLTFVNDRDGFR